MRVPGEENFAPLKGELEPWAVHIHDQSLYIIDGFNLRRTILRFQWQASFTINPSFKILRPGAMLRAAGTEVGVGQVQDPMRVWLQGSCLSSRITTRA